MAIIKTPDQEKIVQEIVERVKIKPPAMYEVLLLNDDYTPMDFVEGVLQRFFAKNEQQAEQITMQVHMQGKGLCGIYPKDIAESKSMQVESFSRKHNHPLQCVAEKSATE